MVYIMSPTVVFFDRTYFFDTPVLQIPWGNLASLPRIFGLHLWCTSASFTFLVSFIRQNNFDYSRLVGLEPTTTGFGNQSSTNWAKDVFYFCVYYTLVWQPVQL